jgi:hypothetical protein
VSVINICGEFVTHKVFGRGQITENKDGVVTVLFSESKEIKKFIYPSAVEQFLMLENAAIATEYRTFLQGIASESELAKKDAAERLAIEKLAVKEHNKLIKKAMKKPSKKAIVNYDYDYKN